mgnify:CR=1 FL=1|jgi:hypothetical protein|tara:strand:- start:16810 stop:17256 length:447 start_codon:yes stop_codon:yes gene_type:complete
MPIGSMLDGMDQQYVAAKDETGTWRVLNTWHEDIKLMDAEAEVPDDSEAVTVLSEGEFIALLKEAARSGVLENATFGTGEAELEAIILDKDQEIQILHEEILKIKEEKSEVVRDTSHTEQYKLKEKAMESILKMVSISDMANLTDFED